MLTFQCPSGHSVHVTEENAQEVVVCPFCKQRMASTPPPPPESGPKSAEPKNRANSGSSLGDVGRAKPLSSPTGKTRGTSPPQTRPEKTEPLSQPASTGPQPEANRAPPTRKTRGTPPPLPSSKASKKPLRQAPDRPTKSVADGGSGAASGSIASVVPPPRPPPGHAEQKQNPVPRSMGPRVAPPGRQQPDAVLPPPDPSLSATVRGIEHDSARVTTVYQMAAILTFLAVLSMWPAAIQVVQHFSAGQDEIAGIDRWAQWVLLVGFLLLAYAVYLVQLPDWSTLWVATISTAAVSFSYALALGMCCADSLGWSFSSSDTNPFVLYLEVGDELVRGQATRWCAIVLALSGMATYCLGRASYHWYKTGNPVVVEGT